jgi:acyl carrier protein
MTRQEIQDRVTSFIASHFELPLENVTPEAKFFEDLGLDSIDAVELVLHLEELTNGRVTEEVLRKIVTIADIVDLVVALRTEADGDRAEQGA